MYKKSALLTFYAETPIHMGAGQSVSYVDLPIQRERHTSFPILWASGIKGVIRDLALRVWNDKDKVETIFGPEDGSDFASCISITDAKILLYPVRSVKGVFAWITCPFVLKRFKEDLEAVGVEFKHNDQEIQIPDVPDDKVFIASDNLKIQGQNRVALEEFVFEAEVKNEVKELAEFLKKRFVHQNDLTKNLENHLAIVSDNVFKDFVNYAVEIRTRIRIDQALGTVKSGALFSEELIPSESVFYSLVFITDPYFGIEKEIYDRFLKAYDSGVNWDGAKDQVKNEIENLKQSQNKEDKEKASKLEEEFNKIKDKVEKRMKKAYENGYFVAYSIIKEFENLLNQKIGNEVKNSLLQLGGDETTGKGYVRVKFYSFQGGQQ
jgi:CRISPR-associated protein Cmr4